MKTNPVQVLILGGGYVSVWAYRSLARKLRTELRRGDVQITVVCPLTGHAYHGWTAETLTDILRVESQVSPLAELMPQATLLTGRAVAVNTPSKTVQVQLAGGQEQWLTYDHLLLGMGTTDSLTIDGSRELGYQIKDRDAFHRTHDALYELVQRAARMPARQAQQMLRVNVAGAGFTGVELATNVAEYLQLLVKEHDTLRHVSPTVRLIHSGAHVLPALGNTCQRLVGYAERTIDAYGIQRIANRRLARITAIGAQLDDGTVLESTMTITTVGQQRLELPGTEAFQRDAQNRIQTNSYQQLLDHPTIWGGGDACLVPRIGHQEGSPSNALWAIKHGESAGRNIARAIRQQSLKPFRFRGMGETASLGVGKAILELYGVQATGWLAWTIRLLFFHYFIPSRRVMRSSINDWLFLFTKRQRIGLWLRKQPRPEQATHDLALTTPRLDRAA
ncbi:NAD(P)/FAD-dependent oxidoreductase [Spirosoma rhododendri]|uniref:FAD-dependent oxidoreductase n=1 Tax=Spirosoma rhododendri TaxID=2728024 RepID=A0A7L5DNX1_9BACT|nr:FAD-dependent oxidoreductase [Spirosoma rhododendri]QJD80159.1 FAD-dependent oxidoreductase [Spirosoma rhododendri]